MWECNLDKKDLPKSEESNNVALSILKAWSTINYKPQINTPEEILNTPLWGNSLIRKANAPIWDKKLLDSDLEKLINIYDERHKGFFTYTQICEMYGTVIDPLTYYAIVVAVPRLWKQLLKNHQPKEPLDQLSNYQFICEQGAPSKYIYWKLVENTLPPSSIGTKITWQKDLDCDIDLRNWENLYVNIKKMVKPVKYQYFQYRILTRSLTTNTIRHKWDSNITNCCTFCPVLRNRTRNVDVFVISMSNYYPTVAEVGKTL